MPIKPKSMTVVFDNEEEINRIASLFGYYMREATYPEDTRFLTVKPPTIKIFGIDYRVISIDSEREVIGFSPSRMSDPVYCNRTSKQLLTVTLERVAS